MTAPANRPSFEGVIGDTLRRIKVLEAQPFTRKTGWTAVFGDGAEPVVVGDNQAYWQVPRAIVGPGAGNWFVFDPSAGVFTPSSSGDIEIRLQRYRVDSSGSVTSITSLLFVNIVIEEGERSSRSAAVQPIVKQGINLQDSDILDEYDFISVDVILAGTDATGLSVNVPIGPETSEGFA